jgi:TPR repeat protein
MSHWPHHPSRLTRLLLLSGVLLLVACTSVPVDTRSPQTRELQQQAFEQARGLFLKKQYPQAAELLLPLARQGHLDAQYVIGYMYHHGYGLPRNEKESTRWIATAATRGHSKAQEALRRIDAIHEQRGPLATPIAP